MVKTLEADMEKFLALITIVVLICALPAYGFEPTGPRTVTGDDRLDRAFESLGYYASLDEEGFIKDLSATYGIPEKEVEGLVKTMDVKNAYLAIIFSRLSGRPIDEIIKEYKPMEGKGWDEIVENLGIKPGEKRFNILKKDTLDLLNRAKERGLAKEAERKKFLKQIGLGGEYEKKN